jgi:hypothetical protein
LISIIGNRRLLRYTHEGHNWGFLKLASQALTVKQPIPKSQIMTFESICAAPAHNKNFNLTGTAIGEFDFLMLAICFLKY